MAVFLNNIVYMLDTYIPNIVYMRYKHINTGKNSIVVSIN